MYAQEAAYQHFRFRRVADVFKLRWPMPSRHKVHQMFHPYQINAGGRMLRIE